MEIGSRQAKEREAGMGKAKPMFSRRAAKILHSWIEREYGSDAGRIWKKTLQKYREYAADAPDYGGDKSPHKTQIYDSMLLLSFCSIAPKDYRIEDLEDLSFEIFMGSFRALGKVVNANSGWIMDLLGIVFQKSGDKTNAHGLKYPADFQAENEPYDKEKHIARYCFTRCPIADFVKANNLGKWMPLMCNCDHIALNMIHAGLIREGTCFTGDVCDYCVLGDQNPLYKEYVLERNADGLLISRKNH